MNEVKQQPNEFRERQKQALRDSYMNTLGPDWSPRRAWELRRLWQPIAEAVKALFDVSSSNRKEGTAFRILAIGRHAKTLDAILVHSRVGQRAFVVHPLDLKDDVSVPFDTGAFDCAAAVDWLPFLRPSQRQNAVSDLSRIARNGIILSNPFHATEIADAERQVNALHFAATGRDHLELGRHIEFGLPDLETVRGWMGQAFTHVAVDAVESLADWQLLASLSALEPSDREVSEMDIAGAALLPPMAETASAPLYRTLLLASPLPLPTSTSPSKTHEVLAPLATQLTMEAAAQRQALNRLSEAVTNDRNRERNEFQATVASLAAELHENEAQIEVLGASLRERERVIMDQTAVIDGLEQRLEATDVHVMNLDAEREATKVHIENLERERTASRSHIENLEKERAATRGHIQNLETESQATKQHVRNLENQVEVMKEHISNFQSELEARATQVRNVENEREVMTAHIRTLEHERDVTSERVRNAETERHASQTRIRKLEAEHQSLSLHIRNLEKEREDTRVHVRNLESEREAMKAQLLSNAGGQNNGAASSDGRVRRKILTRK